MDRKHIETERQRTLENIGLIYLINDENSSWYHAYEWSAYLAEFYCNSLTESERLKPSHREIKDIEGSVIQIGLQLSSMEKYFPNADIFNVDDKCVCIRVNIENYGEFNSLVDIVETLNRWKAGIRIKKSARKTKDKKVNFYNNPLTFLDIMKLIIKYDTFNKNENELRDFINQLKSNCLDIIC